VSTPSPFAQVVWESEKLTGVVRTHKDDAGLQLGGQAEDGGYILVAVAEVHVHDRRCAHVEEGEGAFLCQRLRMMSLCECWSVDPRLSQTACI